MPLHLVRYVWFHVAADGPDPAGNAWAIAALAALAAARPTAPPAGIAHDKRPIFVAIAPASDDAGGVARGATMARKAPGERDRPSLGRTMAMFPDDEAARERFENERRPDGPLRPRRESFDARSDGAPASGAWA